MRTRLSQSLRPRLALVPVLVMGLALRAGAQPIEQMQPVPQGVDPNYAAAPSQGGAPQYTPFTPQQLDELLGPVALYPDPLLAQVLAAATYPMDIVQAARFLSTSSDLDQLDQLGLDPSVQAIARIPSVLQMMDEQLDWTNALGAAFLNQQQDVMVAVQRLRTQAMNSGALRDTPEQEIYTDEGFVGIVPADPQIIYVPQYVPEVVYGWCEPPIGGYYGAISFGFSFYSGGWLNLGFNWGGGCLAYRPWPGYARGYRFGYSYYRGGGWGGAWCRRPGRPLPRPYGGFAGYGRGRGFDGLRRGFGNGPRGGPGRGFAGGPGRGNSGGRGGPGGPRGGGFGGDPRRSGIATGPGGFNQGGSGVNAYGRGGYPFSSQFGSGPRNNLRGPGNSAFNGLGKGPRDEQRRDGPPRAFGNDRPNRSGPRTPGDMWSRGPSSNRFDGSRGPRQGVQSDPRSAGRSPSSGNPFGMLNRSQPSRSGSAFQSPNRSGRSGSDFGNLFGGGRPRAMNSSPRSYGGPAMGGGSAPRRSFGNSGSPSGSRGFMRSPGRSSGGSAFRGGGGGSSGPRMQARSAPSIRPRGSASFGSRGGSGMRSGGGMRSSGMRGGGSRGGRGR